MWFFMRNEKERKSCGKSKVYVIAITFSLSQSFVSSKKKHKLFFLFNNVWDVFETCRHYRYQFSFLILMILNKKRMRLRMKFEFFFLFFFFCFIFVIKESNQEVCSRKNKHEWEQIIPEFLNWRGKKRGRKQHERNERHEHHKKQNFANKGRRKKKRKLKLLFIIHRAFN
jgi:hypothetical protein